jgi:hypothetical protein
MMCHRERTDRPTEQNGIDTYNVVSLSFDKKAKAIAQRNCVLPHMTEHELDIHMKNHESRSRLNNFHKSN